MRHQHAVIHHRALDFWLARAAVLVIICLQLLVINDLSFGPRWLAPALEAALLVPLSVATAWTQVASQKAGRSTGIWSAGFASSSAGRRW
ncbi:MULTISPECIES: hypothetical protein [unclassified Mesorhizobium]|uniref:hypothetical protein n=1 Tax=unclassified Mesorhizobium TaxID=325217 RepID=UPI001FE0B9AC|nr:MULTISPECIES: hypothetical protein [unclassified Mesorhizobium]